MAHTPTICRSLISLLSGLLLAAQPAGAVEYDPARPLSEQVRVKQGEFDAGTRWFGPELPIDTAGLNEWTRVHVAVMREGGVTTWWLVLQAAYRGSWRYYNSASLVGGVQIPGAVIRRTVLDCNRGFCQLAEVLQFPLETGQAERGVAAGLRVRFNAQRGSFEAEVPAAYFAALAQALPN